MTSVEPKKQEPTGNGREPKTGTFLFPTACFLLGCGHRKKTGTAKTDEGGAAGWKSRTEWLFDRAGRGGSQQILKEAVSNEWSRQGRWTTREYTEKSEAVEIRGRRKTEVAEKWVAAKSDG